MTPESNGIGVTFEGKGAGDTATFDRVLVSVGRRPNSKIPGLDRTDGLTKLIVDPATERLLGVGLVGPDAGELIGEGVLAIEMGANATDLKLSIHAHPTLTETLMESAEVFFGQATHVYRPKRG